MTTAVMRNLAVLDRLFRWWVGELAQLVPQRLRRGLSPTGDKLVLYLDDSAIAVCLALWFLLDHTAEGLRLRATVFNPFAARWAGVNVTAQIARAMAISGAVAGLVAITPASGYVDVSASILIGLGAGTFCYVGIQLTKRLKVDDALDVFGVEVSDRLRDPRVPEHMEVFDRVTEPGIRFLHLRAEIG